MLDLFDFETSVTLPFSKKVGKNPNKVKKVKIGRGIEGAAKNSRKGLFGQIWVFIMLPFCDFEVPVMLPFSKNFSHSLPLIEHSDGISPILALNFIQF